MKRWLIAGAGVAVLIAVIVVWTELVVPTRKAVGIGTSMLAKQMCSCMFVAGRSQADCRADQFSTMDSIDVEIDRDARLVRASVPVLGERSAAYSEDFGCMLR